MNDLFNPGFCAPILIVLAEMLGMVYLSRKLIRQRYIWIIGSYMFLVAVCLVFSLPPRDEFGFSLIPLMVIANPWGIIVVETYKVDALAGWLETSQGISFGILLNCAIFYLLGKVSYPRHSTKLAEPQTT